MEERWLRFRWSRPTAVRQYFRDIRAMIANGQPLTPENTEAVMSRYATVAAADFAGEST